MFKRLIFDEQMCEFLSKMGHCDKLSMVLLHCQVGEYLSSEGNFIKREVDEVDMVSYLPKSKISEFKDPYLNTGRIKIKIGRFAKKFILEKSINEFNINEKDIENFVNLFKSCFNSKPENLKIVDGDDIMKYYSYNNYTHVGRCGTLWNSCMRHPERNHHMELYSKNSFIKMLVLFDGSDKIRARALLWDGVKDINGKEYKIMDRIYTIFDHDVNFFKTWANQNGYITKYEQNSKTESIFNVNGVPVNLELSIKLEQSEFKFYPYLDSFKFFDKKKGILYNSNNFPHQHVLMQVNGGLEPDAPFFTDDARPLRRIRRITVNVDTLPTATDDFFNNPNLDVTIRPIQVPDQDRPLENTIDEDLWG